MPRLLMSVCALAAGLVLISVSLLAHHGTNVSYQGDKLITLNGVVTEFAFSYPHPQLYFDVKNDKGEIEHWASELGATPVMMRSYNVGWSKTAIKPGDAVTLTCNPSKSAGAKVCQGKKLIVNGKEMPLRDPKAAGNGEGGER